MGGTATDIASFKEGNPNGGRDVVDILLQRDRSNVQLSFHVLRWYLLGWGTDDRRVM